MRATEVDGQPVADGYVLLVQHATAVDSDVWVARAGDPGDEHVDRASIVARTRDLPDRGHRLIDEGDGPRNGEQRFRLSRERDRAKSPYPEGVGGEDEFGALQLSRDGRTALIQDTVYTLSGSTWTPDSPLPGAADYAISADGQTAIAGDTFPFDSDVPTSATLVFKAAAGSWHQVAQLAPQDATADSDFGESVALSGDGSTAIVGGPADDNSRGAVWAFALDADPPAAFSNVSPADGGQVTTAQPTLMWTASSDSGSGLAGYKVLIDGTQSGSALGPDVTSYAPATALSDGPHTWQVQAIDTAGNVQAGPSWSFTVDTASPASGQPVTSGGTATAGGTPTSGTGTSGASMTTGGKTARRVKFTITLAPSGRSARIAALLKRGRYAFAWRAPAAGTLVIDWRAIPTRAHVTTGARRVLLASGRRRTTTSGQVVVTLKLTHAGHRLLRTVRSRARVTARATFTPVNQSAVTVRRTITLRR